MMLCSSVIYTGISAWVFESSLSSSRDSLSPPIYNITFICIYMHFKIIVAKKHNKSIFQYQITPASSKQDPINTGRVFAAPPSDLYAHKTKWCDPCSIYHRKTKERLYFGPVVLFFGVWVFVIPSSCFHDDAWFEFLRSPSCYI